MVRPHPGFWRIVHGVVILYLLALVFLLFQNVGDARQLLKASRRAPVHAGAPGGRILAAPPCPAAGAMVPACVYVMQKHACMVPTCMSSQ
jgi:hypothetical protein